MLYHKKWAKMVKISTASCENEIHRVDRSFNEDSKNIFFAMQAIVLVKDSQKIRENDQK